MTYQEKLKDPRWQKKRLEIFERDGWKCTECKNDQITLHIHHEEYEGDPWDAPDYKLKTLCEACHNKKSDKLVQLQDFMDDIGLKYRIFPIPGENEQSPESYNINIWGFGRTWKDII